VDQVATTSEFEDGNVNTICFWMLSTAHYVSILSSYMEICCANNQVHFRLSM